MERPLKKRVDSELKWFMSIRKMPHVSGFSYPVFEWSFGYKNGLRGGELRAWSLQGGLVFEDRRAPIEMPKYGWRFKSIEEALAKIDEYGWGEPPYIDEVFQAMIEAKSRFPVECLELAERIFQNLKEEWSAIITGDRENNI